MCKNRIFVAIGLRIVIEILCCCIPINPHLRRYYHTNKPSLKLRLISLTRSFVKVLLVISTL